VVVVGETSILKQGRNPVESNVNTAEQQACCEFPDRSISCVCERVGPHANRQRTVLTGEMDRRRRATQVGGRTRGSCTSHKAADNPEDAATGIPSSPTRWDWCSRASVAVIQVSPDSARPASPPILPVNSPMLWDIECPSALPAALADPGLPHIRVPHMLRSAEDWHWLSPTPVNKITHSASYAPGLLRFDLFQCIRCFRSCHFSISTVLGT